MAGVLETIAVPRAFGPIADSSLSGRRSSTVNFSQFSGLKVQQSRSPICFSPRSISVRRGGRIVCEAQETALKVAAVTDKTWKSLHESDLPVLVEILGPWCGPCVTIHPIINELGHRNMLDGEKKDAVIGAVPKTTLASKIEKFFSKQRTRIDTFL
ncbi:hypothetical protein HAX54_042877 [Datura stramonium]|uniref:Thioredoxin domain-containing protein n=1 Tax=Datura stramonium TaxID=4076 RepID=A0ABS8W052_DATST|nr:hypothetical protein [Datura stramonium]